MNNNDETHNNPNYKILHNQLVTNIHFINEALYSIIRS